MNKLLKFVVTIDMIFVVILVCMGLYKLNVYTNTDYESVNAYVGGDCYNYIINGLYAVGDFILAFMFEIFGIYLHRIANLNK